MAKEGRSGFWGMVSGNVRALLGQFGSLMLVRDRVQTAGQNLAGLTGGRVESNARRTG